MAAGDFHTHALIWRLAGDGALSLPACTAMAGEDNAIFVSAASAGFAVKRLW